MTLRVREPVSGSTEDGANAVDPGRDYEVIGLEHDVWGGGGELQRAIEESVRGGHLSLCRRVVVFPRWVLTLDLAAQQVEPSRPTQSTSPVRTPAALLPPRLPARMHPRQSARGSPGRD